MSLDLADKQKGGDKNNEKSYVIWVSYFHQLIMKNRPNKWKWKKKKLVGGKKPEASFQEFFFWKIERNAFRSISKPITNRFRFRAQKSEQDENKKAQKVVSVRPSLCPTCRSIKRT